MADATLAGPAAAETHSPVFAQREAALAAERVQLALDAGAIIGTWVWTVPDDRFIADERFAHSFGVDPDAIRDGLPLSVLFESIHPDDRERVGETVADALARGGRYRCEYRVRRSDGTYRWIVASGRVDMDANGRPVRFPGVLMDDEERRRVQAERDRAHALLHDFIEAVPGVVYAKDLEGRLIVGNNGVAELLGVPPGEFIGKTDRELVADRAQAEQVMANDRRIMASGVAEQVEEHIDRADGTQTFWLSTKAPMRDADGQVIGLIGTSLDITERRRMIQQLEEHDRRKDEFLAMLAHELRNPLAPIRTATALLDQAADDPARVREVSAIIARQVTHMTDLVDDLLDVSRVTRGLVTFEREPVAIAGVFTTALEQVAPLLQQRGHAIELRAPECAAVVVGDRHRLVQVVSNLLSNAAKYTPPGGRITLDCLCSDDTVCLRVADDGIGMEPELIPSVFELFSQAARTPDRTLGGLGIGLSLVRTIVQAHGGSVAAHSDGPGTGSTFTVVLPRSRDAVGAVAPDDAAPVPGTAPRRVLVVDDNVDGAQTLAMALAVLGHETGVAHDAQSALAIMADDNRWDACVLDIGLPDMTGLELVSRLRAMAGEPPPRFIALTGYGQAHDFASSRQAGFDLHLVKPAGVEEIQRVLDHLEDR